MSKHRKTGRSGQAWNDFSGARASVNVRAHEQSVERSRSVRLRRRFGPARLYVAPARTRKGAGVARRGQHFGESDGEKYFRRGRGVVIRERERMGFGDDRRTRFFASA